MYMDFLYDEVEIDEVLISRLLAGVFFTLASTYVLAYIGPVSSTALIKKDIAEQKKQDTTCLKRCLIFQIITENERSRKENEEANNKTNGSPTKTKSLKKGTESASKSY
ncbi:hypothetical protein MOSE0_H08350 [Monosporozyma servazzii]